MVVVISILILEGGRCERNVGCIGTYVLYPYRGSQICTTASFKALTLGMNDGMCLTSLGIQRIRRRSVQLILDKRQLMVIETSLSRGFARNHGTSLELEMSLVVSREDALDVDHGPLLVALLDDRGEHPLSDSIGRIVVVVIADFSALGFSTANIETVGTSFSEEKQHID